MLALSRSIVSGTRISYVRAALDHFPEVFFGRGLFAAVGQLLREVFNALKP